MKIFTFSQARQKFSSVLDQAQRDGAVRITRRDGRMYTVQPVEIPAMAKTSPLAVAGVDLGLSRDELLAFIQEGRRNQP